MDAKTRALVAEIVDTDWITVESEIDALFLESEMIKRYKPQYNILLRDDKSQLFVRINIKDSYPFISYTRQPLDDGADYFGPYYNGAAVRKALRYLRRAFPYSTHEHMPDRLCLQYHLGLCPGVEKGMITPTEYKKTLRKLIMYLKGERQKVTTEMESEMRAAAANQDYERAAQIRNQIYNLKALGKQILFGDSEFMDISKDHALHGLQKLLGLPNVPRRIEGYDISHMQGTNNVASMVVATNGLADKAQYRKFKMRIPGNDDFAHMHEVISRRFSGSHNDWQTPDLLVIDGGRGQLGAAIRALQEQGQLIPAIGLAKRLEEIIIHKDHSAVDLHVEDFPEAYITETDDFYSVLLPKDSHIVKLLQRVRDESHRFAVSYHTHLKRERQTASELDAIPGIGPATRKKLIAAFGSLRAVKEAPREQLEAVVGKRKASVLKTWLSRE
jgi:excinuclease ABC subunit C